MATPSEGVRKAAVLLSSLPKPLGEQLLARLEPRQAAAATAEMAGLGELEAAERETVARSSPG